MSRIFVLFQINYCRYFIIRRIQSRLNASNEAPKVGQINHLLRLQGALKGSFNLTSKFHGHKRINSKLYKIRIILYLIMLKAGKVDYDVPDTTGDIGLRGFLFLLWYRWLSC